MTHSIVPACGNFCWPEIPPFTGSNWPRKVSRLSFSIASFTTPSSTRVARPSASARCSDSASRTVSALFVRYASAIASRTRRKLGRPNASFGGKYVPP